MKRSKNEIIKKIFLQNWLAPVIISVIIAVTLLSWLRLDDKIPHWDMGRHLYNSVQYGKLWFGLFDGEVSLWGLITRYFYYPPLLYHLTFIFYLIFGVTVDVAVASNIIWILILAYSLYNSCRIQINSKAAFAALLILFSMPMIIGQMTEYQLDLPLTAWVMFTYYVALLYKNEPSLKLAITLGVALGLGMLLKWTYLIFALVIILLLIFDLIAHKNKSAHNFWKEAIIGALISLFLALPWYLVNFSRILVDFKGNGVEAAMREGDPTGLNMVAFGYYAKALTSEYLLIPIIFVLLLGIYAAISNIKNINNRKLLLVILVIYVVFSLLPNKDIRYIMPIVPLLAIVASNAVNIFDKRFRMAIFYVVLAVIFASNILVTLFSNNLSVNTKSLQINIAGNDYYLLKTSGYTASSPVKEICSIQKIIDHIPYGAKARVVGTDSIEFNNWAMSFYLEKEGRIWAGEGDNDNADYWILRVDKSVESRQRLFDYSNKGLVVANINCSDTSFVVILKNAKQ